MHTVWLDSCDYELMVDDAEAARILATGHQWPDAAADTTRDDLRIIAEIESVICFDGTESITASL